MQNRLLPTTAIAIAIASLAACGSSGGGGGGGGGNGSSFCQGSQQVSTQFANLSNVFNPPNGATPNAAALVQILQQSAQEIDSLDSQAPSDISAAFHHLRTAYDAAAQQVQGATSLDQLQSPLAALNDSSLQTDQNTVSDYMKNTCHITPEASPSAT